IGGLRIAVAAGPCAVESREQITEAALQVRKSGAVLLRGGAYKPRTSPYAFQGLGEEGLRYLKEAGEAAGLPVTSEIVAAEHISMMKDYVDVFQIGARNMQNFELLKRVGDAGKPVILKRGLAATVEEWLMAAEYLLSRGLEQVILCERGIRTFETSTRNTLDLSAIPVVKKVCHLPIIVDPSHATGLREKVLPMALAAVAAGADGLIVEVHPNPDKALSDGPQSLYPDQFEKLMRDVEALAPVLGKEVARIPFPVYSVPRISTGVDDTAGGAPSPGGRAAEAGISVAFQGERGAYSEMALKLYFHEDIARVEPCPAFQDVFEMVLKGAVTFGILPLENSLTGSIHENYDLLLQYPDIKIVGEQKLRIEHNLIGLPGASLDGIRKVFSHPQGLAQCSVFLDRYPAWERVPFYDTAGSVAHIAREKNPGFAAIASAGAARVHGLSVFKEGIETNPRNYTRFTVITLQEYPDPPEPDKASLVFSVPDKAGSLFMILRVLADKSINMKKLESRPILGKPWEYMFYVDVEYPADSRSFTEAVEAMQSLSEDFRVLGVYRS
ncbi:MAG: 3-deoxy-7-phosphoheptulonate synthase, partial [Spirochaetales bacterium]